MIQLRAPIKVWSHEDTGFFLVRSFGWIWPSSDAVLFCPLGQSKTSGPCSYCSQFIRFSDLRNCLPFAINKLYYFISLSDKLTWTPNYSKKFTFKFWKLSTRKILVFFPINKIFNFLHFKIPYTTSLKKTQVVFAGHSTLVIPKNRKNRPILKSRHHYY
jgi:hypothetical protein